MKLARTREWREARGWTQQMLADEARLGKSTVVRVELGANVSPKTATKLAEALEVSIMDLQERPPVPLREAPSSDSTADSVEARRREMLDLAERFFEAHDLLAEWSEVYIDAGDQKKLDEVASLADIAVYGAISYIEEHVDIESIVDDGLTNTWFEVIYASTRMTQLSDRLGAGQHDELAGRRRKYKQIQDAQRRIRGIG